MNMLNFSHDYLLNGCVSLKQPIQGYRVAIDPIFLSASVSAEPGEFILDVGSGVGAASLCLAYRIPHCRIVGIEQNKELVHLATDNVKDNNFRDRVEILCGNLLNPPPRLAAGSYSQVISNPPFFENSRGRHSPLQTKKESNHGADIDLDSWVKFCLLMLKPSGKITFIINSEMLDKLLSLFFGKVGNISLFPLWVTEGKKASKIIVRGVKGSQVGLSILPGLFLHNLDGSYSSVSEKILRFADSIMFENYA